MKNNSFFVVQGWMINCLKLKSNELLIFAIIYGFSKDNQGKFDGSLKYLADASGTSKNTVINALHSLIEKEYIIKENVVINNITFCKYLQNDMVVQNLVGGGAKFDDLGGAKFGTNSIINNNIEDKKQILFSNNLNSLDTEIIKPPKKQKKESDRAILFSASDWINYDTLREHLKQDKEFVKNYKGVDLKHYISKAEMWSENNPNKKRTNRGWLLTLRDWMRSALENNELKLLKDFVEKKENNGFTNH